MTAPTAPAAPGASWRNLPIERKKQMLEELKRRRAALVRKKWPKPADLAVALDPTTKNPPHLAAIDEALVDVIEGRCERLMILMPPQEGKSERTSHYGALWMLLQNPELRIAIASYEVETARRWGQVIRNDLITFRLPLELQEDSRAAGRWNVAGHRGGVYCVGIGGALTGRPVDVLLIDDPVKDRAQADSAAYRKAAWDWWTDVARTRLAPGAPAILVMTRWHDDDLGGRILKSEGGSEWRVLRIPAQADHKPELGQVDLIGREPGEFLPSARDWPEGRWASVRRDIGTRSWNALYQGRPTAEEGNVWQRAWWRRYDRPVWTEDAHGVRRVTPESLGAAVGSQLEMIQSWDLTFKDTKAADYVVGQVWVKCGAESWLLDQIRRRMDFPTTIEAIHAITHRWPQASTKLVEDKANGPAVISSLKSSVTGLTPIEPQGGKESRAQAVSPFIEAGNVIVPSAQLKPWIEDYIEEAAAFPNGVHDDQVDAASQALHRLYLAKRSRILV